MNLSTTIPTTIQIRRELLIGLVAAAAVLAALITWLLVAVAFDSGRTSAPGAANPGAVSSTGYPPNYRGMP